MWLNQAEVEAAARGRHNCPNVRKGVRLLYRLMEATNAQSDGWAYWPPPSRSARGLMELLTAAGLTYHGSTTGTVTDAQLVKAVAPIRAMVARQRKRQKQYGNTFEFDVDAALGE